MPDPLGLRWIEAFRKGNTADTISDTERLLLDQVPLGKHTMKAISSDNEIDVGSFGFGRNYFFMITNQGGAPRTRCAPFV